MANPCHDPASDIVDEFLTAMRQAFNPESDCPPDGGGSTEVRFFAGDDARPAALIPVGPKCKTPLLWVRVDHRHRSTAATFPDAFKGNTSGCAGGLFSVLALEVGVGRCVTTEVSPKFDTTEREATISLDDSWRIDRVLCVAAGRLRSPSRAVATDTVAPFGPDGGVVAWTGLAYVQL